MTLIAERRRFRPWGLKGGKEGEAGAAWIKKAESDEKVDLPGKCSNRLAKGDTLHIETPGGGGWGKVDKEAAG